MALVVRAICGLFEAVTLPSIRNTPFVVLGLGLTLMACGSELEGVAPGARVDADTSEVTDTNPDTNDTSDTNDPSDTTGDTEPGDTTGDTDTDVFVPPPEWQVESLGDLGRIDALELVSAELGFATSGPRVLRWDGRSWLAYGEPGRAQSEAGETREVHGVGSDGALVAAVGEGGLIAVRPVDGGEWALVEGGPEVDLYAAVMRGGRLFVAGDGGTVASIALADLSEDAPTFTTHFTSPNFSGRALWADPTKSDDEGVHGVTTGGYHVFRDGSTWRSLQAAANVTLLDIVGLANGDLVAVGDGHTVTIKRTNSPAWQGQATNDDRRRDLAALALSRDGTLRAFGASGVVLRQEGTTWSLDSAAGVAAGLRNFRVAATVPNSSAVMALASEGGGVRFDGTTWQGLATSPESTVNDLAGTAASLWAVGNRGVFAHRVSGAWSAAPLSGVGDLNAVAVTTHEGVETAWAVGDAGAIVKATAGDSTTVTVLNAPVPLDLFGVVATEDAVWASGRGGTLLEIDPATNAITVRASGTTADLKSMALGGDGAVWISGSFGTLLRKEGAALPQIVASGVGGSLNALAPTASGVLAVGDNGVVLRATAAGVTLENEEPGRFLYAVATSPGARDTVAIAVGAGGRILRQSGADWLPEVPAQDQATFEAAWIDASGEALVGGIYRVHHLESRLLPFGGAP
jgi:hypothetical protein